MGTYQSKYTGEEIDNGINPVGNIISYMGTIAPDGYLICDGAEVNIADYPKLATHFETQFGSKNHFGGNGTTTFAVPDLRNEFLRGYHCNGDEQLSGEVGIHQDATEIPNMLAQANKIFYYSYPALVNNPDKTVGAQQGAGSITGSAFTASGGSNYTSRPTNIAVLYCIKY